MKNIVWILALALALPACKGDQGGAARKEPPMEKPSGLEIDCPDFAEGGLIPARLTCDGQDLSPALSWRGVPGGAVSLALICDDPDAPMGTWVHWVLFDLPAAATGLPEGLAASETIPGGGVHGRNSWGRLGYGGPCPPRGTHRYFFKLFALDARLDLPPKADKTAVEKAMAGHILAQGQLMGRYARR